MIKKKKITNNKTVIIILSVEYEFSKYLFTRNQIFKREEKVNRNRGRSGPDRIVVGFMTTCAISAYHH